MYWRRISPKYVVALDGEPTLYYRPAVDGPDWTVIDFARKYETAVEAIRACADLELFNTHIEPVELSGGEESHAA